MIVSTPRRAGLGGDLRWRVAGGALLLARLAVATVRTSGAMHEQPRFRRGGRSAVRVLSVWS
jgi:hypothetical protein